MPAASVIARTEEGDEQARIKQGSKDHSLSKVAENHLIGHLDDQDDPDELSQIADINAFAIE